MSLDDILEREWQNQVVDLAKLHGWRRPMHIHDSRRSEPGWPDLALVRENDRLILLELKREKGATTAAQRDWLTLLASAGVEVYVARPRHLQALSRVFQARGPIERWTADQREARHTLLLELDTHIHRKEAA